MYYAHVLWVPKRDGALFVVANAGGEAAEQALTDGMKALLEILL